MNILSKQIGQLFKQGKQDEANSAKAKTVELKEQIKEFGVESGSVQTELNNLLVLIPNIPNKLVTPGKSEEDNVEIRKGGEIPILSEDALPHWDIAQKFDIIDFELGNKITGAGFPVYKGKGARLQRSLINFSLIKIRKQAIKNIYHL